MDVMVIIIIFLVSETMYCRLYCHCRQKTKPATTIRRKKEATMMQRNHQNNKLIKMKSLFHIFSRSRALFVTTFQFCTISTILYLRLISTATTRSSRYAKNCMQDLWYLRTC